MRDVVTPGGRKIFVRTLGGLSIEPASGEPGPFSTQRKALALVALLATAGDRGVTRDSLMALLWPENDLESARNALSQLLFRLRRELGANAVVGDGRLCLERSAATSDILEFEAAISRGDFEAACAHYAGPFLDGFFLRDGAEFERWTAEQRTRLELVYFHALERLAIVAAEKNDHAAAARWWRRRIDAEPLNSRGARGYAEALIASGDREAALAFSVIYTTLVRAELGVDVDPETARLFERARAKAPQLQALVRPIESRNAAVSEARPVHPAPPLYAVEQRATSQRLGVSVLAVLLLVAASAMVFLRSRTDNLSRTVMVAPFTIEASDSSVMVLGRIGAAWVADGLAHTGLAPIFDAQMLHSSPSPSVAELARSSGAGLIVTAEVHQRGDSVEFNARILRAPRGRVVSSLAPILVAIDDPGAGLATLSSRIAGALAALVDPRVATLVPTDPPAPRFAAYQEFVEGLEYFMGRAKRSTDYGRAVDHFERAVQLDSTFNLPYVWMVLAYGNLGMSFNFGHFGGWQIARQDSVVDILMSRRPTLSRADRSALDFFLAERRGDHETAYRAITVAASLAPGSVWTYLRGVWAKSLGYYPAALSAFRELDADGGWITDWSVYWRDFAEALHAAGRSEEELVAARRGARGSADPYVLRAMAVALGGMGDAAALDRFADSIAANPGKLNMVVPGAWLSLAAQEAHSHGHEEASNHIAKRCVRWYQQYVPDKSISGAYNLYLSKHIDCLYLAGGWRAAQAFSEEAINRTFPHSGAMATLVLIAAREGDTTVLRQRLDQAFARPAFAVDSLWRHQLAARLAALRGDTMTMAFNLRFLPRPACHHCPEITLAMRRSPVMKDVR